MSELEMTTTLANPILEARKRLCHTTKSAFLVIQEGGSSMEMYAHGHGTLEDAEADRISCRDCGSYRTSEVIEVPESLASHPNFWDIAEKIAKAALEVDYPGGA